MRGGVQVTLWEPRERNCQFRHSYINRKFGNLLKKHASKGPSATPKIFGVLV